MANLSPVPRYRAFDANGAPLAGGKLLTYTAGSTTMKDTFTDSGGLTANTNPVILDANGEADVWLGSGEYKFVLTDSADVVQSTVDNVPGIQAPSTGASQWATSLLVPSFVDATNFTLVGDQTADFEVNRRLSAVVSGGTVYGTISASLFDGGTLLTTVTVSLDSGVLDSGISSVSLSILTSSNDAIPFIPPAAPNFFGAVVTHSIDQAIVNGAFTALSFDSEDQDTDTIHDTVTNNSRLIVPTGVTKIRLHGQVSFDTHATGYRQIAAYKNGSIQYRTLRTSTPTSIPLEIGTSSPVLTVTAGDYFELRAFQNSGGTLNARGDASGSGLTWFEMEIYA